MNTLGSAMRDARCKANKTLRAFAAELDVSPALLSLIERGRHAPNRTLILRAADLLDADANYWCALAGTITSDAEAALADMARRNPTYFRRLVSKWRANNG